MQTLEHSPCGLIEFTTAESRAVIRTRCGNDDTLQNTLISLACDDLADVDLLADFGDGWNEIHLLADVDQLEQELLLIYERVVRSKQ